MSVWNSPEKWNLLRQRAMRAPHGTNARYSTGCRCAACRIHRSEYERTRPYNNRGHGRTVSAEPARKHIRELARRGIGHLAVAEASGVNHNIVWGIRTGERKRARRGTVERILAVDLSCARPGTRIPAGPTWRILDGLIERGFTRTQLAYWLGYRGPLPSLQIPRDFCTAGNAMRVERMAALLEQGKLYRGGPGLPPVKPRGRGGYRKGKLSDAPRCACGKMTLRCAKARSHHCGASA